MRRRLALIGAVALAAAVVTLLLGRDRDPGPPRALVPGAGNTASTADPLAWDPDREGTLEAIVLLESAGRPDAQASEDLDGAVGLTQILAETGRNLLGMRVDVQASARLPRGNARGRRVAQR